MSEELGSVIDAYEALCDSEDNRSRGGFWEPESDLPEIVDTPLLFGRAPRPVRAAGRPPIAAPVLPTIWARWFGFSLKSYFTEPKTYLLYYLKSLIEQFKLGDDTVLYKKLAFWPGASYAPSLYGVQTLYSDTDFPWLGREQVITKRTDLLQLQHPDFRKTGLMPLAHRFYEEGNELLRRSDLTLTFPRIIRGPFGMAFTLRGVTDLGLDLMDDPAWVLKLMSFLTEGSRQWHKDWSAFTGLTLPKALMYEDEVDGNLFGPQTYESFVLPFETELSEFLGGTVYWHSCGNITKMLPLIGKIPGIRLLNVSAWTDYHLAAKICCGIPLELCIPAVDGLYLADEERMRRDLVEMLRTCAVEDVKAFTIRLLGVSPFHDSVHKDLEKIKTWIRLAKTAYDSGKVRHDRLS